MYLHSFLTLLILLPNFCQNKLTIETSYSEDPLHYTCDQIEFPQEQFIKCICIKGLWAFSVSNINKPSEWKLIGNSDKPKCIEIGAWIKRMEKISDSPKEPKLHRLGQSEKFVVANGASWEITLGKNKFCLPGAISRGYCIYELPRTKNFKEDKIQKKCSHDSKVLKAVECESFDPSEFEVEQDNSFGCKIVPTVGEGGSEILNRVKRAEGDTTRKPFNITMLDEDYLSPEDTINYMGEMPMMESISDYMLSNIVKMLQLNNDTKASRRKRAAPTKSFIPPILLLRNMGDLVKKMCPQIKTDLWTLAQEVFLTHQKTVYHIKEPYIAYAPFKRILKSLEVCTSSVVPFQFFQNLSTPNATHVVCKHQDPPITSYHILDDVTPGTFNDQKFHTNHLSAIPQHAASDPNVHEPIVELAWKLFVISHNHCYEDFSKYYNDHHTLTTTLLPYFSNQIQNIWLLNGTGGGNASWATNSSGLMNYSSEYIWYNNLLGNISTLYFDLNNCYSASKQRKQRYPWFLNRPDLDDTNQWVRPKRATQSIQTISGAQCQLNPVDFL